MTLRLIALGFALAAICPPALALVETTGSDASAKGTTLKPSILSVSVGADGTPVSVACKPEVAQFLCPILVKAVSGWKFSPGQRAGVPAAMYIALTLDLVAVPKPGGFGVRATGSSIEVAAMLADGTLAPSQTGLSPPRYPPEENRLGRTGSVLLELLLQPDSDVPRIGKAWFNGGPPRTHNPFVIAATAAAAGWKINHVPEQQSVCVPVDFFLSRRIPRDREKEPCKPTYAAGFAPPTLITKVESAVF